LRRRTTGSILLAILLLGGLWVWRMGEERGRAEERAIGRTEEEIVGRATVAPEGEGGDATERADADEGEHAAVEVDEDPEPREDPEVDEESLPRVHLSGRVRLKGTDRPVTGGRLWLSSVSPVSATYRDVLAGTDPGDDDEDEIWTLDARGEFRCDLPAGSILVSGRLEKVSPWDEGLVNFLDTDFRFDRLLLDRDRHLDLEAEAGALVAGVVLDAIESSPIEGAVVRLTQDFGTKIGGRSGPAGRFLVSGIEPERVSSAGGRLLYTGPLGAHAVRFRCVGYKDRHLRFAAVKNGFTELTVRLSPLAGPPR
jgi:hypothetical protein